MYWYTGIIEYLWSVISRRIWLPRPPLRGLSRQWLRVGEPAEFSRVRLNPAQTDEGLLVEEPGVWVNRPGHLQDGIH